MLRVRGIFWPRPTALNLRHSRPENLLNVTPHLRFCSSILSVTFTHPSASNPKLLAYQQCSPTSTGNTGAATPRFAGTTSGKLVSNMKS
jgi:hypothetical protein